MAEIFLGAHQYNFTPSDRNCLHVDHRAFWTRIEIVSEASAPPLSVTVAVIVCFPRSVSETVILAPVPSVLSLL